MRKEKMDAEDKWRCGCEMKLGTHGCGPCGRCVIHCICGAMPNGKRASGDTGQVKTVTCSICGKSHTCIID